MVQGKLTGWLELVDASSLATPEAVDKHLQALGAGDEHYECSGVTWNADFTTPLQMEVTYWDNSPPDFAEAFDNLSRELAKGEYLLFEEKVRYGLRTNTLRSILVTRDEVRSQDSSFAVDALRAAAGLPSLITVGESEEELEDEEEDKQDM